MPIMLLCIYPIAVWQALFLPVSPRTRCREIAQAGSRPVD